jgi:hypothetical protein
MNSDPIKEDRPARPWDLLNRKVGRVSEEIADNRYLLCKGCDRLAPITNHCLECGCFMKLKVTLPNASCPLGKWGLEEKVSEW